MVEVGVEEDGLVAAGALHVAVADAQADEVAVELPGGGAEHVVAPAGQVDLRQLRALGLEPGGQVGRVHVAWARPWPGAARSSPGRG